MLFLYNESGFEKLDKKAKTPLYSSSHGLTPSPLSNRESDVLSDSSVSKDFSAGYNCRAGNLNSLAFFALFCQETIYRGLFTTDYLQLLALLPIVSKSVVYALC